MLDRKIQPKVSTADKFDIIKAKKINLENNIPVYYINAGIHDLVKVDFIFDAGTINHKNPLVAEITNMMLDEGTKNMTSFEIAEKFDFYGAFLKPGVGRHYSTITLYTLNKYFGETISLISEMVSNPIFPEKEYKTILQNELQSFIINKEKTEKIASKKFWTEIYGKNHPYGIFLKEEHFKKINADELKKFHEKFYTLDKLNIIISGNVDKNHIEILQKKIGNKHIKASSERINVSSDYPKIKNTKYEISKNETFQKSVRIGKRTINKHHPDYIKLNIANVILGGYFGSRLMTNVREEKGYTYGIYSSLGSIIKSGYFIIAAETGLEVADKAIEEIYKEIKLMRTKPVSDKELNRVKKYMIGNFSRNFDGAFALSSAFKSLLTHKLGYDYYEKYFETIKSITPQEIKNVAEQYLDENSMITVIVGGSK